MRYQILIKHQDGINSYMTYNELERLAYMANDPIANVYGELDDAQQTIEVLEQHVEVLEQRVEELEQRVEELEQGEPE